MSASRLLYPRKRTFAGSHLMSALGQKQKSRRNHISGIDSSATRRRREIAHARRGTAYCGEYCETARAIAQAVAGLWRSRWRARSRLLRRMRSRRRLIHIISDAEPADSADSVQTLLKGYKAAIGRGTGGRSILRAPRIVLRFSGFFEDDGRYENSHDE
jgi:hypothetical protein